MGFIGCVHSVCVLADSVTQRPFPGSGPGCGQGSGRNNVGESLNATPAGISSQTGSQPIRTLAQPGGWRWLFGNISERRAPRLYFGSGHCCLSAPFKSVPSFWKARVPTPPAPSHFGKLRNKWCQIVLISFTRLFVTSFFFPPIE